MPGYPSFNKAAGKINNGQEDQKHNSLDRNSTYGKFQHTGRAIVMMLAVERMIMRKRVDKKKKKNKQK
ncbi:MAG: hypothetical protein DRP85_05855 [Candidatus Makaraimicrobium thalassicum]|nr:MAG: hypothetical protein DRP85_05855 [Candidatus Omnitrophota bacterium]